MKNYVCPVLFSGIALTLGVVPAPAGSPAESPAAQQPTARERPLSRAQMDALVKSDLKATCDEKVPTVPRSTVKEFPVERVARTLHGVWRGRVWGEYPKEFTTPDGLLNVDYYWIIDTKNREALILEQLTDKRAAPEPKRDAPIWTFVTCGREGYKPRHPRQVHEFQKVSDQVQDVSRLLATSTGLKVADATGVSLSSAWKTLVENKYFDTRRFGAFAGGLFKPFELANFVDPAGTPVLSLNYSAEYRGAGETAARFESGVAIHGREGAQFIGATTPTGDYLVASEVNGTVWAKEATVFGTIDMTIDKVVIGPLVN